MKRFLIISAILAGSLLLLACLGLFMLWRASQVVPDFYAEVLAAEPTVQRDASDTLVQKASILASDVHKSGGWETLFTEQEINGWLAVDLKENHPHTLPPEIADPRVVVELGGLKLACKARWSGIDTVFTVALDVYMLEPNVLGIRIRRVRAGVLPLPLADVLDRVAEIGARLGLSIQWQQADGDPVAIVHLDSLIEGDKLVVVNTIELAEGEIYLAGTTEEIRDAQQ